MELALILAVGGDESDEFRRQSADLDAAWSERGARVRKLEVDLKDEFKRRERAGKQREQTQNLFPATEWEFESPWGHHNFTGLGGARRLSPERLKKARHMAEKWLDAHPRLG